ncbi:hypothetical protein SRB17_26280 [Streptomyces sp. RB17]|uniref:hypothetical protein n=1 Tax=Streptomyces sp. RB17 TaxID=2585197 RepID=UPI0012980143|nr:hypothetical protein [Streptomyces sp. RB17]MQY34658.1 hypothetical protein [Streptomyces sp. RB17]
MTEPGLFELEAVVVGQPKRSRWRRYVGPDLAVSTVQGTPLAWVTYTDDTYSVLAKTSGEFIVRIEQFGPVEFRFTNAAQRVVGTAGARGLIKTRQLSLQTEQGRQLLLTRPGLLYAEWHLTETDPQGGPAPEILGRVTMSTIDAWIGLQQYVVEMDPRMDASERRTVVASVVCLHLLRRPPGNSAAPA